MKELQAPPSGPITWRILFFSELSLSMWEAARVEAQTAFQAWQRSGLKGPFNAYHYRKM